MTMTMVNGKCRVGRRFALLGLCVGGALLGLSSEAMAASPAPPSASGPKPSVMGQVSDSGGYATAVPLELPTPRGQVPVPVSVTHTGGGRVGEAGVGWSIPLSYVRLRNNVSEHKPKYASLTSTVPSSPPTEVQERVSLDLGTGPMLMNPVPGTAGVYRPLLAAGVELRKGPSNAWLAMDGAGRVYTFTQLADLKDKTLWVLSEVRDRTQENKVTLTYSVETPTFPNQTAGVRELLLTDVRYAFSAQECAKYRIQLNYIPGKDALHGADTPSILAFYGSNGAARVRTKVLDSIVTWAASDANCSGSATRLTSTRFSYTAAPDTILPLLTAVDQYGEGQPPDDLSKFRPVARYKYGASVNDGKLSFAGIHTMDIQDDAEQGNLFGGTASTSYFCGLTGQLGDDLQIYFCPWAGVTRAIRDMTGDSRADLLFTKAIQWPDQLNYGESYTFPKEQGMFLARTIVDQWGSRFNWAQSFWDLTSSFGAFFVAGYFHNGGRWLDTTVFDEYYHDSEFIARGSQATRQLIDWNGDGRTDVLWTWGYSPTANEPYTSYWHVDLNTRGYNDDYIAWKPIVVDYAPVVAELKRFVTSSTPVIFDQFKLDRRINREECWEQYSGNVFHNTCSPTHGPGYQRKHNEYNVITEWKVMDVNGDKLPDFVFSAPSNEKAENGMPGTVSTEVRVMYNRGGIRPFDGESVRLHTTTCGVERMRGFDESSTEPADPKTVPKVSYFSCGFLDVNGDGLIDYVDEDDRETRPPQYLKQVKSRVYLGTGIPGDFKLERSFVLPGPITVNEDFARNGCPSQNPGGPKFDVANQWSGLVDLTGDGIPDFVYRGLKPRVRGGVPVNGVPADDATTTRWWIMPGTGAGFAVPVLLDVGYHAGESGDQPANFEFSLSKSVHVCDADGQHPGDSMEVAGLADMDGDGIPEAICSGKYTSCGLGLPSGTSQHQQLFIASVISKIPGKGDTVGAPTSTRLVEIDNGYGGVTKIDWGNAKTLDVLAQHNAPVTEIVVTSTQQVATRGLGPSTAPVLYAYTDPQMNYDPLNDQWSFTGYGRRLQMTGTEAERNFIKGSIEVTDTARRGDLPEHTPVAEQIALIGKIKEVNVFQASFIKDPWQYVNIATDGGDVRIKRGTAGKWGLKKVVGGSANTSLDCQAYKGLPYNGPSSDEWAFEFPVSDLCSAQVVPYMTEQASWEGDQKPQFGVATSHAIQVHSLVKEADGFGRPVLVEERNDVATDTDNVCLHYEYARTSRTDMLVLDAMSAMHVLDCKSMKPIAGTQFLYDAVDGGSSLPIGTVDRGLLTEVVQEVYEGEVLTSSHSTEHMIYDKYGNVTTVGSSSWNPDSLLPKVQFKTRKRDDAFSLVVTDELVWGLDTDTLKSHVDRDPTTLLPTRIQQPNGAVYKTKYDGFGRPYRTSAILEEGGPEYLMSEFKYVDDPTDAQSPRVVMDAFENYTTLSSGAGDVTRSTVYYDEFGRTRFFQTDLGADYGNRSTYSGFVVRDALGRTVFEAEPFQTTNMAAINDQLPGLYGTTYYYGQDGLVQCAIRGNGPQANNPVTSPSDDRYPTCFSTTYQDGHRITGHTGPNENLPSDDRFGIVDQNVFSATGLLLSAARMKGTEALEREALLYDPLGTLRGRTRFGKPATLEEPTAWTYVNDSLGRVLKAQEPGEAERSYSYDTASHPVRMSWMDGGHLKGQAFTYDSLGRMATDVELLDGEAVEGTKSTYHYDKAAESSEHVSPTNLQGRLAWAENKNMRTYLGYDRIGKITSASYVNATENVPYVERWRYTSHGQLEEIGFELPDASGPEAVRYSYDSAHRVVGVDWIDDLGSETLFTGREIDDFGRYTNVTYGNNVVETWSYRPDRRRELQEESLVAANGTRYRGHVGYDGEGRETQRIETKVTNGVYSSLRSTYTFDLLNRLSRSTTGLAGVPGTVQVDESYTYSSLGALTKVEDNLGTSGDLSFEVDGVDRDRICRSWNHSTQTKPSVCNHGYDQRGNTLATDAGTSSARSFTYNSRGDVVSISKGAATASFAYDPFGAISSLDVTGATSDNRADRRYGRDIERNRYSNGQFVIERKIYGPNGLLARRRGPSPSAITLYEHSDRQGGRFFTDQTGAIVQEEEYTAFGAIRSETATVGDIRYTKELWNSGDTLRAFGVTQLGPRLYDARLRRFLQRDPMSMLRGASSDNPYAFALNDPVNFADPSGFDAITDTGSAVYGGNTGETEYHHYDTGMYYGWFPNGSGVDVPPMMQYNGHYIVDGGKIIATYKPISLDGHKEIHPDDGAAITDAMIRSGNMGAAEWGARALGAIIDSGAEMLKGIANMAMHPQQTVEALYDAASHPIDTAGAIGKSAWGFGKDLVHGKPEAFGKLIFGGASLAAGTGIFGKLGSAWDVAGVAGEVGEAGLSAGLEGGLSRAMVEKAGTIETRLVRFSQDTVSPRFSTGQTLNETIEALSGPGGDAVAARIPPIKIFERGGNLYTLDNRRLASFAAAGRRISYTLVDSADPAIAREIAKKFTTTAAQGWGRFVTVLE
jgi:RHS repeat-associated protein